MTDDHDTAAVPPTDLSPIDPLSATRRFDSLAQSIVRDSMAARHAATIARPQSAMTHVARWSMPILAAAAVIVAAAIPTLAWSARNLSPAVATPNASSDRLGFPAPVLALTRSGSEPTPADVIAAFDSRWREATR